MTVNYFVQYLAYPACAITNATMQQELAVYDDHNLINQHWGIEDIMPQEIADVFNDNRCGYQKPIPILSDAQRHILNAGVSL